MATTKGRIKAISVSKEKGTRKYNIPSAELTVELGIKGDAHAGNWHRLKNPSKRCVPRELS